MKRIILIDADVVSHFISAGEEDVLHQIFPYCSLRMLDNVHRELQKWPRPEIMRKLSNLLSKKRIQRMDFPEDNEEIKRAYFYLKSGGGLGIGKGDGESACLAVARYQKNIVASSNLKDIRSYCEQHRIDYLTTMDFLCEAVATGLFDEARCDAFITAVRKVSRLPVEKFADYTCRIVDFRSPKAMISGKGR